MKVDDGNRARRCVHLMLTVDDFTLQFPNYQPITNHLVHRPTGHTPRGHCMSRDYPRTVANWHGRCDRHTPFYTPFCTRFANPMGYHNNRISHHLAQWVVDEDGRVFMRFCMLPITTTVCMVFSPSVTDPESDGVCRQTQPLKTCSGMSRQALRSK